MTRILTALLVAIVLMALGNGASAQIKDGENCNCPGGKSWGFCENWESYNDLQVMNQVRNGTGFVCN